MGPWPGSALWFLLAATRAILPGIPEPPFAALVEVERAQVRATSDERAEVVGILRRHARVRVVGCTPDCADERAWAWLSPMGALRLSAVRAVPEPVDEPWAPRFIYAKAVHQRVPIRASPSRSARVIGALPRGRPLAFIEDATAGDRRFLRRPEGGYVSFRDVRLYSTSALVGERSPPEALAFVLPRQRSGRQGSAQSMVTPAAAYRRFAVSRVTKRWVYTEGGAFRRRSVRLARRQPRPASIPEGAKWVHVDLGERTLTAYEGDSLVFSTVVAVGRPSKPTPRGTFRVSFKSRHDLMRGANYAVEEAPGLLFFHRRVALHGAYWHDRFGQAVSRGCINLSPEDASALFEWAPPVLAEGWHSRRVFEADESLWVRVDGPPRGAPASPVLSPPLARLRTLRDP